MIFKDKRRISSWLAAKSPLLMEISFQINEWYPYLAIHGWSWCLICFIYSNYLVICISDALEKKSCFQWFFVSTFLFPYISMFFASVLNWDGLSDVVLLGVDTKKAPNGNILYGSTQQNNKIQKQNTNKNYEWQAGFLSENLLRTVGLLLIVIIELPILLVGLLGLPRLDHPRLRSREKVIHRTSSGAMNTGHGLRVTGSMVSQKNSWPQKAFSDQQAIPFQEHVHNPHLTISSHKSRVTCWICHVSCSVHAPVPPKRLSSPDHNWWIPNIGKLYIDVPSPHNITKAPCVLRGFPET